MGSLEEVLLNIYPARRSCPLLPQGRVAMAPNLRVVKSSEAQLTQGKEHPQAVTLSPGGHRGWPSTPPGKGDFNAPNGRAGLQAGSQLKARLGPCSLWVPGSCSPGSRTVQASAPWLGGHDSRLPTPCCGCPRGAGGLPGQWASLLFFLEPVLGLSVLSGSSTVTRATRWYPVEGSRDAEVASGGSCRNIASGAPGGAFVFPVAWLLCEFIPSSTPGFLEPRRPPNRRGTKARLGLL